MPGESLLHQTSKNSQKRPFRRLAGAVTPWATMIYQDGFLKSSHTLRAQKFLSKRIISGNTASSVPFLAPIRSATAGRALTRRPFVDRVGNRRVTDDFLCGCVQETLYW